MNLLWRTRWDGPDIVVLRDDLEIDRFAASAIERIVFVYRGAGHTPGDLLRAIVATPDRLRLLAPETGFAGRVLFERVDEWARRRCVYWVARSAAPLPLRVRRGNGWLGLSPPWIRTARSDIDLDAWPLKGAADLGRTQVAPHP